MRDPIIFVIFIFVLPAVVFAVVFNRRKKTRAGQLRSRLGLRQSLQMATDPGVMTGSIDGISVQIERHPAATNSGDLLLTVKGPSIPDKLQLTARGLLGSGDVTTGDAAFDAAYLIDGDPMHVSSELTADMRRRFLALPPHAAAGIDCGALVARLQLMEREEENVATTHALVAIARAFAEQRGSAHDRLLDELKSASSSGVAMNAFSRLMNRKPTEEISRAAIDHALASKDPAMLAVAVPYARTKHAERLREIFAAATADDYLRAAALDALRSIYEPPPVDLGVLAKVAGPWTRAASARFLGADERVNHDVALLEMLLDPDQGVQTQAARALARVGTIAAVDPLQEWAKGVFRSVEVKEVAAEAIRAIQSRAGSGAGRGQLSMTASDVSKPGAVSLSDRTGGELSVEGEDDGSSR